MNRPLYETQDDLNRELALKVFYERRYNCVLEKLPISLNLDYVITDKTKKPIYGYVEIKDRRKFSTATLPDFMISEKKFAAAKRLTAIGNYPFYILAQFMNGKVLYLHNESNQIEYKKSGRTVQTRDSQDIEVCAHIPWKYFQYLGE